MKAKEKKPFSYKFDAFRNKMSDYLRTRCPLIYKLCIRCKDHEYYILRRVLSFPIGFLMGYLFFKVILMRFDFPENIINVLKYAIISSVTMTYSVSIEMRAICWLVLPTFSGRTGRSFIIALLITRLGEGPVDNLFANTEQLFISLSCTFGLSKDHIENNFKLITNPMQEIMNNLVSNSLDSQNLSLEINKTNERLLNMFSPKNHSNKQKEMNKEKDDKQTTIEPTIEKQMSLCKGVFIQSLKDCKDSHPSDYASNGWQKT